MCRRLGIWIVGLGRWIRVCFKGRAITDEQLADMIRAARERQESRLKE